MYKNRMVKLFWKVAAINNGLYLRLRYWRTMKKKLHLRHPITYTEKLQWLKLYYHEPIMTDMVDKIKAKQIAARQIGSDHIIPLIGSYDSVDEINWTDLPKSFVLKCNHDSGGVIVCRDKANLDIEHAKTILSVSLANSYYKDNLEWPYKDVKRKILCEQYMVDESGYELKDYKWFCFNGVPRALFVASDRNTMTNETKFDFFDADFNRLSIRNGHPNSANCIDKPKGFDEMKLLAAKLSAGFPHVRIDLYDIDGHVFFGEYTFFHWSGFVPFEPEEWDGIFGEWLTLPSKI